MSCIFFARPVGTFLSGVAIKRYRAPWQMLRGIMVLYFLLYLPIATGKIRKLVPRQIEIGRLSFGTILTLNRRC